MAQGEKTILIVEDDKGLSSLIREYLDGQGYSVRVEEDGERAVERIPAESPDLVILDLMLPGKDGLSVCRAVRAAYAGLILILTAREDDMDQVAGLETGADDYVKKPVKPRVLLARIRALFRRSDAATPFSREAFDHVMQFGTLKIDPGARRVIYQGEPLALTTIEFDILSLLAGHSGQVMEREVLFKTVKGYEWDGLDRSVDMAVSRLRKKFDDDADNPLKIKTVWGTGYLFVADAWAPGEEG